MPTTDDIREIKRRLADRLLAISGVSGVGVPSGRLTVYLEKDSRIARKRATDLLNAEAPGTAVDFIITGVFLSGDERGD